MKNIGSLDTLFLFLLCVIQSVKSYIAFCMHVPNILICVSSRRKEELFTDIQRNKLRSGTNRQSKFILPTFSLLSIVTCGGQINYMGWTNREYILNLKQKARN